MATKATHPTPPHPDPGGCPVCGGPVPDRTGKPGRRAVWCSKGCRQVAWRARSAAERAGRDAAAIAAQIAGGGYGDVQNTGAALVAAVLEMCEQGDDLPVDVALRTGHRWERDVADAARSLAAAATRIAELAEQHAARAADYRRAHTVIRRAPASAPTGDESPAGNVGIVAATAAEASETNPPETPAVAVAGVDADELFDAIEDVVDVRDTPGVPQDLLQDQDDVPGTSFADALEELADAHAAASGDGPHGELVAAAAAVVRSRPPYLPACVGRAMDRLAAVVPS